MESFVLFGTTYNIHTVTRENYDLYQELISQRICATNIFSSDYETLTYESLEFDNYIGFFLTNQTNTILHTSLIVDLTCDHLEGKTPFATNDAVCIALLCSNLSVRVKQLTSHFVNHVIKHMLPRHTSKRKLMLYVTKGETNKSAVSFYEKLGFRFVNGAPNIMQLGGRVRHRHKKTWRFNKRRNKHNTKKRVFNISNTTKQQNNKR